MLQGNNIQEEAVESCFDCGEPSDPTILGLYQICPKCYQVQVKAILQYKASRTTFYPSMDQILPHLFLGNQDAASNQQFMNTYQIGAVLVCGSHLQSPFEKKMPYKKFLIADDPKQKIINLFPEAYEWIQSHRSKEVNVLVHCAAGVSRSASFVISYLMKKNQMRVKQAHDFVKSKRSCIYPNSGFIDSLQKYQKCLFPEDKAAEQGAK